jgi:hypothetical protein
MLIDTVLDCLRGTRILRWANVFTRAIHQGSVVGLGAAMLGASVSIHAFGIAVFVSGLVLYVLEALAKPGSVFEASGLAVIVKFGLVLWLAIDKTAPGFLFWFIVGWSTLFAHAPGAFRHIRLFGKG